MPPPPPPPPAASVFEPLPYGSRAAADPQSSWDSTQQYAPVASLDPAQQYAPQQAAPTSFPPPAASPASPFAPQPTGPQPGGTGPQHYTPQPTGPQQYTSQPSPAGPQHYAPQPGAPTGPQHSGPTTGPQSGGPDTGPQSGGSYAGPQSGPQPTGPHYAPQPYTPQATGPQQPPSSGPQRFSQHGPTTGPQNQRQQPPVTGPGGFPQQPPATGPQQFPQDAVRRQADGRQFPEAPAQPHQFQEGAAPAYVPPGTETTVRVSAHMAAPARQAPPGPQAQPGQPGQQPGQPGQPGPMGQPGQQQPGQQRPGQMGPGQMGPSEQQASPGRRARRSVGPSNEPADPYKPFVTAGQISGPKTPPPERQQELWNTVFGDNYEAIGEEGEEAGHGKRVWLFALIASVVVALLAALLWAFLAGPLRPAAEETAAGGDGGAKSTPKSTSTGKAGTGTTKSQSASRLPKYTGTASPRAGTLTDKASSISLARLGGPWQLDLRSQHVRTTYGFETRQYVAAGSDTAGTPQFAQVMTGPLAQNLATKYSSAAPDKLAPVISSVAFAARNKFFPDGNKVVKTAEQRLSAGGRPARVVAYQILTGTAKTTLVVGAVSTGADLPVIVYMSVPDSKKALLPDINTVFSSIRPTAPAS
ncbi:hypothetical protein ACFO8L_25265 [Sphaerisporangium corydalis]|uniref:Uncharacterized protein n=1 Tax=Sphaerisporangium corydalis TaxID=1441875 RepID=A0ABV9EIR7_9ACTN